MRSNVKFGARLHDWYEAMMTCYEHLSDSELQDLRDWERSPAFTRTDDWPGWLRYIGARAPRQSSTAPCFSPEACVSDIAIKWLRGLRFAYPDLKMTQGDRNVLTYLAVIQTSKGKCLASENEIAKETGLSPRHVKRCLKKLRGIDAINKWEKGKAINWASSFEFGLGFVFKEAAVANGRELGTSCPVTGDIVSSNWGHPVEPYKERNKVTLKQENQKQHSFAALNDAPHSNQASELNAAIKTWLQIKEHLKATLPVEDFNLWVRPMYLFRVMADGFLLFTLPPNDLMFSAARANQHMLIELLQKHGGERHGGGPTYPACSFTYYPDEYQLDRMRREAPEFYEQLPEALKKRRPEKVLA
jgi:hypothetical protein